MAESGGDDVFERMTSAPKGLGRWSVVVDVRRRGLRGGLGSSLAAAKGWTPRPDRRSSVEASADTVGKWRRRYAAEGARRSVRRTPPAGAPRQIGDDASRGSGPADAGRDAAGRVPLEPSLDGAGERPRALDHSIASGGPSACSRSLGDLQAVERSLLRGEGPRRSSVACIWLPPDRLPWALCRRKEPDPGLGPFPAPLRRCAPGRRSGAATTTSATARPLSSRPSTSPRRRDHRQLEGFPRHRAREFRKFDRPRRGERPC